MQGAVPEACNGVDDDCDGAVDEDGASLCNDLDACSADACTAGVCTHAGICGISGSVRYYRDDLAGMEPSIKSVPDVGIGGSPAGPAEGTTDLSGAYTVDLRFGNVTVTPVNKYGSPRASDHNGAISSLDAARAAQAAVGGMTLSTNQVVAGDVTGNGTISALDASYIARFSAQLVDHFPVASASGSDWSFLKCEPYGPPDNPGCGPPVYSFSPLVQSETGKDFYAVLYGDVTGNWQPSPGPSSRTSLAASAEEESAVAQDRELAGRFRRDGVPPVSDRRGAAPAELSLGGWGAVLAGERRQLTVDLRNAEGILGLDLALEYDPSRIAVVGVQATGIGSQLVLAQADVNGTLRIAGYGVVPLSGSGPVLKITVEVLRNTEGQLPLRISGVANEGGIPLRVRGRVEMLPRRP
jgi:hypothetical protein